MNPQKLKTRLSCGVNYNPKAFNEDFRSSLATQKLISHLKTSPGEDINKKLRTEVFLGNFKKGNQGGKQALKRSSSHSKLQESKQTGEDQKHTQIGTDRVGAIQKFQPRTRKYQFYSPKGKYSPKETSETSPFTVFKKEIEQSKQLSVSTNPFTIGGKLSDMKKSTCESEVNEFIDDVHESMLVERPDYRNGDFLRSQKNTKDLQNFLKNLESKSNYQPKIEDFTIFKELGEGTFGEVYGVIHKVTGGIFTLKKYRKDIIRKHELEDKFIKDIQCQTKMSHQHIVKLYGYFSDTEYFYMLFEYMESGNLTSIISERGSHLPEVQIFRKVSEINEALLYLHQKGFIHRDIKPCSVLTCLNVCKIGDTQWIQDYVNKQGCSTLCREIDYIAPEALEGKVITPEFDVWGLGLIAYELLTGKNLFKVTSQKQMIRQIVSLTQEVVAKTLPQTCSNLMRFIVCKSLEPIPHKRLSSVKLNDLKEEMIHVSSKGVKTSQIQPEIIQQKESIPKKINRRFTNMVGVKREIKGEVTGLL